MNGTGEDGGGRRPPLVLALAIGTLSLAALAMIVFSLSRPTVDGVPPTVRAPQEVGDSTVGPIRFTIDATDPDRWTFFDFSTGTTVDKPGPTDWDLAFRRFRIIANGGKGFAGEGAIADLGEVGFESVLVPPSSGWVLTEAQSDSTNAAIAKWYEYGFTSHLLTPKPRTYTVRTADGTFAKIRILNYYCPGAVPGCVTMEYVYWGGW